MFLGLRLKIRNFFKKHKNKIIIVVIIWLIVIIINNILGHRKKEQIVSEITYNPHKSVLKSDFDVPSELENPIETLIDNYVNHCNNNDYSEAYKLLSDSCKKYVFDDSEESFTEYAKAVFDQKKRYSIQDYSNYGSYYIYEVKIIDDILATGLTNQEYSYYTEKWAISRDSNDLKLNVRDYMGHTELKRNGEDDNLKIRIETRDEYYNYEIYTIRITNRTEKDIVIFDTLYENEITIEAGSDVRTPTSISGEIHLIPEETRTFQVTVPKFYDENKKADTISFNKIRIMNEQYTGLEKTTEEEESHVEKTYSMSISIQKMQ
jgi:hypothetical protein